MKLVVMLLALSFSLSVFAMTEVECSGRGHGKDIKVTIDGRWNQGYYKTGVLWVRSSESTTSTRHSLNFRAPWGGIKRAEYSNNKLRLEIDLWPDGNPRWGRTYFGNLWLYENNETVTLNCRFPFAASKM